MNAESGVVHPWSLCFHQPVNCYIVKAHLTWTMLPDRPPLYLPADRLNSAVSEAETQAFPISYPRNNKFFRCCSGTFRILHLKEKLFLSAKEGI